MNGTNFLDIQTGGNSRIRIDSGGKVGIGTTSPATTLDVNGSAALRLGTDLTTTGSQNNVAIGTTSALRYAGTAAATFTGLAAGANGQVLYLHNASSSTLTLSNQSASSTAANRLITGTGSDLSVPTNTSVSLQYDSTDSRWRVTGSSNSANTLAAGSTGEVQFNGGTNLAADSNFYWDNTNKRLGIGTTSPTSPLDVVGVGRFSSNVYVNSRVYIGGAGAAGILMLQYGANGATSDFSIQSGVGGTNNLLFQDNKSGAERMRIDGSGNVGIGTNNPASTLAVNGSMGLRLGTDLTTTGSQNNVSIGTTSALRYSGASAATFTGLAAGANGQVLYLHNASSSTLTLSNQSASSTAANRLIDRRQPPHHRHRQRSQRANQYERHAAI